MTARSFKKNRILITAGPTWAPIDGVRVISNISSGKMGLILAKEAAGRGFKVDLLLGPVSEAALHNRIRLFRFCFFKELQLSLSRLLRKNKYDIILHAAAVSDFLPDTKKGKISSEKCYSLKLHPAPKLVRGIRRLQKNTLLVIFKLEAGLKDALLLKRSLYALRQNSADIVIANTIRNGEYKGFVVLSDGTVFGPYKTRFTLCRALFNVLESYFRFKGDKK